MPKPVRKVIQLADAPGVAATAAAKRRAVAAAAAATPQVNTIAMLIIQ